MKRLSRRTLRAGKWRARLGFESLDPRVMLDAAGLLENDPELSFDLATDGLVTLGRPTVDDFHLDGDGWTQSAREAVAAEASVNVTLPFSDTFDGEGFYDLGPQWTVQEGMLKGDWGVLEVWRNNETAVATLNGVNESNVSVSAYLGGYDYHHAGLLARCSGPGVSNCYMGAIAKNSEGWYDTEIWRNLNGTWTRLASQSLTMMPGTLRFDVVGSSLSLSWDSAGSGFRTLLSARDTALASGTVGIRGCNGNATATFDNFTASVCTSPPVVEDATLPFSDNFDRPDNPYLGPKWTEWQGHLDVWYHAAYAFGDVDSVATLNGVSASDVRLRLDGYSYVRQHVGLLARCSGPSDSNCYMGALVNYGGELFADIWRNVAGTWTQLASEATGDFVDQYGGAYTGSLRFEVIGSSLTLHYRDAMIAHAQDTTFTSGTVGIRGRGTSSFGDFVAEALSAPAAQDATLPYSDAFNRADSTILGSTWTERLGEFAVVNNQMAAQGVVSIATLNGINQANVSVSADVNVVDGYHAGLVARYSGPEDKSFYLGHLLNTNGQYTAEIWRNVAGFWTQLSRQVVTSGAGTLRFDVVGSSLSLCLNNILVGSVQDTALTSGTVGVRGGISTYDNFAASTVIVPPVENAALPYSDAFNRADSTILGGTWTEQLGDLVVVNNQMVAQGVVSIATLNGIDQANVSVSADVNVVGGYHAGLVARYSGPGDKSFYLGHLLNTNGQYAAEIWRNVAGFWTQLSRQVVGSGAGTLRFDVVGSSLGLYVNNALVGSVQDTALTSGTVGVRGGISTYDNFAASVLTAPAVENAALPYSDTFDRADSILLGGTWTEQLGDLVVVNNQMTAQGVVSIATLNGINQANVSVSADVNVVGGYHAGLVARYSGPGDKSFYLGHLLNTNGQYTAEIWRNVNGAWTQLRRQVVSAGTGNLKLDVVGSSLKLYLNNALVASVQDTALASGTAGVRGGISTYDDFAVSTLTAPPFENATLPYSDTFNRENDTFLGSTWSEQFGDLAVVNNQMAAQGNLSIAVLNGINQANVSVSADVNVVGGYHAGLVARYSGPADTSFYLGHMLNTNGQYTAEIWRNVAGAWTQLSRQVVAAGTGNLAFNVVGSSLKLYWNSALVGSVFDTALAGGTVGVRGGISTYDNFSASAQAVPANVIFQMRNLDGYNEGFNDPSLGSARRTAFQSALNIWSQRLIGSYVGETITIDAKMDSMGGSQTNATLGGSNPNSVWKITRGGVTSWYADALANHLSGRDLNAAAEIEITFNSDVDNSYVLGNTDWYYGLDGNSGSDIDFVSVVAHEIGHGLNFLDLVNQNGSWFAQDLPGIYDRFLEDAYGNDLVTLTQSQRAAAITSNYLYWNGAQGAAGNGGVRPKMYAPSPYQGGSSVSHLDETAYPYELMSPYYSGPDHSPSAMELGMLREMGWEIAGMDSLEYGAEAAASLDAAVGTEWVSLAGRANRSEFVLATPAADPRAARFVLDVGEQRRLAHAASFDARMDLGPSSSLQARPADEDAFGLHREGVAQPMRSTERLADTLASSHVARRHRLVHAIDRVVEDGLVGTRVALDESLLSDLASQWRPDDWTRG
ncbi:MAG: hypothetical protein ACYC35_04220 [Pirellulales bacterium]